MSDFEMIDIPFDVKDEKLRHEFFTDILPQAVNNLDEHTSPFWGKMTAQHMIEHLIWTFDISAGNIEVSCRTPENMFPRIKLFLQNNKESPHDFKNPLLGEYPPALQYTNFIDAKNALIDKLTKFLDHFKSYPEAIHIHPLFGPLGNDEWQRTHFKHCYHHLLQFGIIKESRKETT
jgi:hypothetical protein